MPGLPDTLRRLGPVFQSLVMLAVGAGMLALASGSDYSAFMNPKYRWLTIFGGAGILAVSAACLMLKTAAADRFRPGASRAPGAGPGRREARAGWGLSPRARYTWTRRRTTVPLPCGTAWNT